MFPAMQEFYLFEIHAIHASIMLTSARNVFILNGMELNTYTFIVLLYKSKMYSDLLN